MKKYHSEKDPFRDRTIIYDEHGKKSVIAKRQSLAIMSMSMIQKEIRLPDKKNHSLETILMSMMLKGKRPVNNIKLSLEIILMFTMPKGIRLEKVNRLSGAPVQIITAGNRQTHYPLRP